jgi:ABC-type Fe3+/spermidine/putrescine transport system ATPase subunit
MVELVNIHKHFGDVRAVDGVSLKIEAGEMVSLLGPSGCGKTTLLRVLSGFLKPSEGSVVMDGRDVTALPPDKRPTSLVFQNYALFPHMNVFDNIAFGLRIKKLPMARIRTAVADMLKLVGLTGMEQRAIRQLSGGQQQRVALARALVMEPAVLLLDEPLSNLDAKLRVETRVQIRKIQQSVGITSIFVTHDQEEALTISDRIAIMDKGRIIQFGTPEDVYYRPNSNFVAGFVGKSNFLAGNFEPGSAGNGIFTLSDGTRLSVSTVPACDSSVSRSSITRAANPEAAITGLAGLESQTSVAQPGTARMMIRPERCRLLDAGTAPAGQCAVMGSVEYVTFLGEVVYYHLQLATGESMMVPVYGTAVQDATAVEGRRYLIAWEPDAGLLLKS